MLRPAVTGDLPGSTQVPSICVDLRVTQPGLELGFLKPACAAYIEDCYMIYQMLQVRPKISCDVDECSTQSK